MLDFRKTDEWIRHNAEDIRPSPPQRVEQFPSSTVDVPRDVPPRDYRPAEAVRAEVKDYRPSERPAESVRDKVKYYRPSETVRAEVKDYRPSERPAESVRAEVKDYRPSERPADSVRDKVLEVLPASKQPVHAEQPTRPEPRTR